MGQLKSILVTGANGFLGSHVLRELLNDEHYLPIILLRSESDTWRINTLIDKCKIFRLSKNNDNISDIFNEYSIDAIVHTATSYGRNEALTDIIKANVLFPIELIEQGLKKGVSLFINTDSFFAKKQYQQSYLNEYTTSKRILEQLLGMMSKKIKIVNLRIEHVFGEDDSEQKFITSVFMQLLQGKHDIPFTTGDQKRDFIYVKDVAKAYINVLKGVNKLGSYQEFEVGSGNSISIKEFIELIANILKSETKLNFGKLPLRVGDIQDSFANTKGLQALGWHKSFTLEQAIKQIAIKEQKRFL